MNKESKAKRKDEDRYIPVRNHSRESMKTRLPKTEMDDTNGRPILNIGAIDDTDLDKTMKRILGTGK